MFKKLADISKNVNEYEVETKMILFNIKFLKKFKMYIFVASKRRILGET